MSLLYYVSIGSFFFFFSFCSSAKSMQSPCVHFLIGWQRCVLCVLRWTAHRNICWNVIACACLFTVKKAWLLYRLLKTQLNQMSWDCFKLDPWAVCGGSVCASVSSAPCHCTVPQWCMMLWNLVSALSGSNEIQYVILGSRSAPLYY